MRQGGLFRRFIAKPLHAAGDHIQHRIRYGANPALDLQLVNQPLHNAA